MRACSPCPRQSRWRWIGSKSCPLTSSAYRHRRFRVRLTSLSGEIMDSTAFPTKPIDVVALTTVEFSFDVDGNDGPSLAVVCARFVDDANRALVWLIRFRALREWLAR